MRSHIDAERRMNQEKDEFIAGLSHELRTPLTSIVGFSQMLIEEGLLEEEHAELLGIINADAADLSRMVDDLLAAARLTADALTSRPQRFDLSEQASIVATPYLRTGENINLEIPHLDVYADPFHVRQIIHNLVSNARRHGGNNIVISGRMEGSKAVLVVADDGEGVPPDEQEKLFQRFSNQGKKALVAGSVGLGLAISQELAMRMRGVIRYSRVDGWTNFSLILQSMPKVVVDNHPKAPEPDVSVVQGAV
jgi:signal transduction histidine kinase